MMIVFDKGQPLGMVAFGVVREKSKLLLPKEKSCRFSCHSSTHTINNDFSCPMKKFGRRQSPLIHVMSVVGKD